MIVVDDRSHWASITPRPQLDTAQGTRSLLFVDKFFVFNDVDLERAKKALIFSLTLELFGLTNSLVSLFGFSLSLWLLSVPKRYLASDSDFLFGSASGLVRRHASKIETLNIRPIMPSPWA
jgi:hypothetical protein